MTANPNASDDAKRLLDWLIRLPDRANNRLIVGQQLWHGDDSTQGYKTFVQAVYDKTGLWPSLLGLDYTKPWLAGISDADREAINTVALDWWSNGGLVTMTWLENNPWTKGEYKNKNNPDWDPMAHDLRELTEPGPMNDYWMTRLETVAQGLAVLRDAGVVVLWRPFLESTYGATQGQYGFWWSSPHDPGAYFALWRHMFNHFTVDHGFDNLLWIYNSANQDWFVPLDAMYPGDDVVDIVSCDAYAANLFIHGEGYQRLVDLGKPFYIAETGCDFADCTGNWDNRGPLNAIRDTYPKAFGWMVWFTWDDTHQVALVDNLYLQEMLTDPLVITRDTIDWKGETITMPILDELQLLQTKLAAIQTIDLQTKVEELEDIIARLTVLRTDLSALSMMNTAELLQHVANAQEQLSAFDQAVQTTLGL